jgi:hypothetical protein
MMTNDWITGKDLEGSYLSLIDVLSWHLPGGTEENFIKVSHNSILAKIQTKHLPSRSQENYL